MPGVTQQEAPAVAEGWDNALVHLEVRSPAQVGESGVGSDPGVDQRREFGRGRRLRALVVLVAVDEDEPLSFGQRREQHETARPYDDAPPSRRRRQSQPPVRDDETPAIGFAVKMLL